MAPRLVGINHVALEVGSLDEALAFYGRLFDVELRGRIPGMMADPVAAGAIAWAGSRRLRLRIRGEQELPLGPLGREDAGPCPPIGAVG